MAARSCRIARRARRGRSPHMGRDDHERREPDVARRRSFRRVLQRRGPARALPHSPLQIGDDRKRARGKNRPRKLRPDRKGRRLSSSLPLALSRWRIGLVDSIADRVRRAPKGIRKDARLPTGYPSAATNWLRQRKPNMRYSKAKIRFQSVFMLTTIQPSFFASS